MDIIPGEWNGTEMVLDFEKKISVGDTVKVILDFQFQDSYEDGEKLPRRVGETGVVVEIDEPDEWAYKVKFKDGGTNWFKRYLLEKKNCECLMR